MRAVARSQQIHGEQCGLGHGAMFAPGVGAGCTGDPRHPRGRPCRAWVAEGIRLLPWGQATARCSHPR
jgi:hypothetical protein